MRFCPFCSADNADEATHCGACARRLPPPPKRRADPTRGPTAPAAAPDVRRPSTPPPRASTGAAMPAPHARSVELPHVGPAGVRRPRQPSPPPPPGTPERRGAGALRARDGADAGPEDGRAGGRADAAGEGGRADAAGEGGRADGGGETRAPSVPDPPPTRVTAADLAAAPKPIQLDPVPDVPDGGVWSAARYAVAFARARWQRRRAVKQLQQDIRAETAALDELLGVLGKQVRAMGIDNRALRAENAAIDAAEAKRAKADRALAELANREAEERARFAEISAEREDKVREAQERLEKAQAELAALEAQRRTLRDQRKQIERQQKANLKAADDRDAQAAKAASAEERAGLRRAAEDLRRDAADLDPQRQDIERRLAALERPIEQAAGKVAVLEQELDAARASLNDAREGHRHRLAEIEAEQGRRNRELAQAEAEIQRRLVTLGTIVNLHRIDAPEFAGLYERIDKLRSAIGAKSTEIDRLLAEREAYDRASLIRGTVAIGAGVVVLITVIALLAWLL
ncbi:MAG: hypothetical protein D6689_10780 [Deltaproteobacteria bacterium]|nr:MAG: hypothetical protein D6689_10780 [Deltaproteobacteria bacterium]